MMPDPTSPQSVPKSSMPRAYTEQEKRHVIAEAKSRRTPSCPIDGTAMDVQVQRSLGRTSNVVVRCPRCDGRIEYVRAHG